MAYDLQLAWPCSHLTVGEVVRLDVDDRRSLRVRQPVASQGSVRIMVNDQAYIPPSGLLSSATLTSQESGPFDLVENEDEFRIETPEGVFVASFAVRGTQRWETSAVVKHLQRLGFTGVVANVNGHLSITDALSVGGSSFVAVSGTAAAALGFGTTADQKQRRARGKQVYPGWSLVVRTDAILNRYPVFDEPVRGDPVFKVTYAVPVQRCLRCRASFVENDARFGTDGEAVFVQAEDLLYQASLKMLLTDRGSNPYHGWYGTRIRSMVGQKAVSDVASLLADDIRKALSKFQSLQTSQAKYQTVVPQEKLRAILSVDVRPHVQDPTTFLVEVVVQNAAGTPVELNIVFTVPDVVALAGTNGLTLGAEVTRL